MATSTLESTLDPSLDSTLNSTPKIAQPDTTSKKTCHHSHGSLKEHLRAHFSLKNLKKLGLVGVIIFVLHILFHVVEFLVIPALIYLFTQP